MIRSNPIDIPSNNFIKRKINIVSAVFSKPISSYESSAYNTPFSGLSICNMQRSSSLDSNHTINSLSKTNDNKIISIEMLSPIKNYNSVALFIQDAFPVLTNDEIEFVLQRLGKVKVAKIECSSLFEANIACSRLVENGLIAWVE